LLLFFKKEALSYLLLSTQSVALTTLTLTTQPQSRAAHQAAALATPDTITLLPYGNDGTGIPGPFIAAAPDSLRILLLRPGATLPPSPRFLLITLGLDSASRATLADFHPPPCYRQTSQTQFTRTYATQCPHPNPNP
jgi:hypothetical protein